MVPLARRRTLWRLGALALASGATTAAIGLAADSPSTVAAVGDASVASAPALERDRILPSDAFPSTRRRGDVLVSQGVIVGVQDEALDAVVRPDGGTDPGFPLPVGTVFFLTEQLFGPDPASPRDPGQPALGTGRTRCVVQPPQGLVITCDVSLELTEGSSLVGVETIDFRTITPNEPLSAAVAVTGGTGRLTGATGECTLTDREDHDESGISFYDCRVAQPVALLRPR